MIDLSKSDLESAQNRSSRGLRALSLKVKEIVGERRETSYKEVAELLISEIGPQLSLNFMLESV